MTTLATGTLDFSGLVNIKNSSNIYNQEMIENLLKVEEQINFINKNTLPKVNKNIYFCRNILKNNNLTKTKAQNIKDELKKAESLKSNCFLFLEELNLQKEKIEKFLGTMTLLSSLSSINNFVNNLPVNNEYYINKNIPTNLQIENINNSQSKILFDENFNFSDVINNLKKNYEEYLSKKEDKKVRLKGGIFEFTKKNTIYISSNTINNIEIQGKIDSIEYYNFEGNPDCNKIRLKLYNPNIKKISKLRDYFSIRIINRDNKWIAQFNCDYEKGKSYMSDLKYISIIEDLPQ